MMRCPDCLAEPEGADPAGAGLVGADTGRDASLCARCGAPLVAAEVAPDLPADVRLGTFHPAVADRVAELLYRRAIAHRVLMRDDTVEIRIDTAWRDDVRAELTLTWSDLLGGLDDEVAEEVRADVRVEGSPAPGWLDAPQGGHIDRAGRLVVGVADDADEARVIGPALLAFGAILAIVGWYAVDSPGLTTLGAALAVIGLLTPR